MPNDGLLAPLLTAADGLYRSITEARLIAVLEVLLTPRAESIVVDVDGGVLIGDEAFFTINNVY